MRILLDTSIWVECNEDSRMKAAIEAALKRHESIGCEAIDKEMEVKVYPYIEKGGGLRCHPERVLPGLQR